MHGSDALDTPITARADTDVGLEHARVRHRLLMCQATHFAVDYVINPWMDGQVHQADGVRAQTQWRGLRDAIGAAGHAIDTIAPAACLPDMVFTANAGLVLGNDFVPSRFRHRERSGEEPLFIDWCRRAGLRIRPLPSPLAFEGAGDALLDRGTRRLWMGHGHRSDLAAAAELERMLDIDVVPLRLVDPRFYHLDTCFCPLRGGRLLYFPAAFDAPSRLAIELRVPPHLRIAVDDADALAFACNAMRRALATFGYRAIATPLDEFLKSGGSAKCLTLRLDEPPLPGGPIRRALPG